VRDQERHVLTLHLHDLWRVELDLRRTAAQLVELLGVEVDRFVADVAVRKEKFGGAFDAGRLLTQQIHFAFPALSELRNDLVFAREFAPWAKVKSSDGRRFLGHRRASL